MSSFVAIHVRRARFIRHISKGIYKTQKKQELDEPEPKQAKVESMKDKMGVQNAALSDALTTHLESKIDSKFETIREGMEVIAVGTDEGLKAVQKELEKERKERLQVQDNMEKRFAEIERKSEAATSWPRLNAANTPNGKGSGKGVGVRKFRRPRDPEKRARTIVFRNVPKYTKRLAIEDKIREVLTPVLSDIDDRGIYAFGSRAKAGAARFKTSDAMWAYMVANVAQGLKSKRNPRKRERES